MTEASPLHSALSLTFFLLLPVFLSVLQPWRTSTISPALRRKRERSSTTSLLSTKAATPSLCRSITSIDGQKWKDWNRLRLVRICHSSWSKFKTKVDGTVTWWNAVTIKQNVILRNLKTKCKYKDYIYFLNSTKCQMYILYVKITFGFRLRWSPDTSTPLLSS